MTTDRYAPQSDLDIAMREARVELADGRTGPCCDAMNKLLMTVEESDAW